MNNAIARPRLFTALDDCPAGRIPWLVAAGGYGKTTLAVSYAQARGAALLHLAVGDAGLTAGELFFRLREQAVSVLGEAAEALPVLNPEYSASPEVFTRRFAEELVRHLPAQTLLFLDDLHRLDAEHPIHAVLAILTEALDGRLRLVIASRHEPPPAWAPLRGRGQLRVIDESMLAFDRCETETLLDSEGMGGTVGEQLLDSTRGWPVGVMLLLEHYRRTGALPDQRDARRPLADWFGHEILAPLDPDDQLLLRACALPAYFPVDAAAEATGVADAAERLARLQREHAFIFTEADGAGGSLCRFHDLFRDFLRREGEQRSGDAALAEANARWGRVLWQRGHWSEAARLFLAAGDDEALANGVKSVAGAMLQSGRGDTLFGWLQALPEQRRRADPILTLWEGMCLLLQDTAMARGLLAEAWEAVSEARDYAHMAIAWSGIVDSIWLEWAHVSKYEYWIDEFLRFEADFREHLPRPLWLTVLRGMVAALCYGRPLDPSLERWEREALSALSGPMPDNERVMLACQLLYLNTWQFGRRAGANRVMAVMDVQQDAVERASPLARCLWKTFTALCALLFDGDRERCLAEAEEGRALIREYGIGTWDCAVPPLHAALCFDDAEALADWMAWFMRTDCKAARPFYDTFQAHFLSGQAWLRGDVHEACAHAGESITVGERHGSVVISSGFRGLHAAMLAEAGDVRAAVRMAAAARRHSQGFPSDFLEVFMYLALARIPLYTRHPERALPYLRRAFAAGERQRMFFPLMVRADELSYLCALALAHDVAPDYARWLIRTRSLAPPADGALRRHWPWRCRIVVFDGFRVIVDGETRGESGRGRPLPRALLAWLVFAGPRGLSQERLAEALWPESGREKALNSLYVTVHRLRDRILDDSEAVVSEGGRVRLDGDRVWVDAWAFQAEAAEAGDEERRLADALALYSGSPTLPGVDPMEVEVWETALERSYERLAVRLGELLEARSAAEAAIHYRAALVHAPLSEVLWSGAMRSEAAQGNTAAVQRTWRELERCFERELDAPPSPSLAALYQQLAGS
ncbi:HTH-type transcriptional regulator MalT [wastewater metagenome]|uniref:HTH-type transcriptional regulator MalT n=3 Tax=root TaxID=1 RepID=A0A5B8RD23_9ZZZZ|nr:HTH-type transcriptional regulator MalT [uncultured organism]